MLIGFPTGCSSFDRCTQFTFPPDFNAKQIFKQSIKHSPACPPHDQRIQPFNAYIRWQCQLRFNTTKNVRRPWPSFGLGKPALGITAGVRHCCTWASPSTLFLSGSTRASWPHFFKPSKSCPKLLARPFTLRQAARSCVHWGFWNCRFALLVLVGPTVALPSEAFVAAIFGPLVLLGFFCPTFSSLPGLLGSHTAREAPVLCYQLRHWWKIRGQGFVQHCMLHFLICATATAHVWNTHGTLANVWHPASDFRRMSWGKICTCTVRVSVVTTVSWVPLVTVKNHCSQKLPPSNLDTFQ